MRDLKRLFEETEPFERSLVLSGRDEAPPDGLEGKILRAYAAAPAPNASPAGKLSFLRHLRPHHLVLAMAAVGAGAITTTVIARSDAGPSGGRTRTSDVSTTQTPTSGPIAPAAQESPGAGDTHTGSEQAAVVVTPDSLPSVPATTRAPGPSVAVASGTRALGGSPGKSAPHEVGPSLERELEVLAMVKASLGADATSAAARALDLYDAEFPQGVLRPEATVLRIRTLLLQGNRPAAHKLADDYLGRYPSSVHGKRIRALLAE